MKTGEEFSLSLTHPSLKISLGQVMAFSFHSYIPPTGGRLPRKRSFHRI